MTNLLPQLKLGSAWLSLLLTLVLAIPPATAQKIRFCDTSNKWSHPFCDWGTGTPSLWCTGASSWYNGDTTISGINYHMLQTNNPNGGLTIAVREDTILQKVYFRLPDELDTVERILYDYNLQVGDTLKIDFYTSHYKYAIGEIDSVQMAGNFYKRWKITNKNGWYYLIEGIGTNRTPLSVLFLTTMSSSNQLQCFSNKGVRPRCAPSTPVTNVLPNSPGFFDNDSSCVSNYVPPNHVGSIQPDSNPLIAPNPGGREAILTIPSVTGDYNLTIRDIVGRVVASVTQSRAPQQPIGRLVQTVGLYFYSIQLENGQRLSGRFLFR